MTEDIDRASTGEHTVGTTHVVYNPDRTIRGTLSLTPEGLEWKPHHARRVVPITWGYLDELWRMTRRGKV